MKQIIFILLFLPSLVWAQPVIVFTTEHHDFGYVIQGVQLEYVFEFMNTGSDELIIKEVNIS